MPSEVEFYNEISNYLKTTVLNNISNLGNFIVDFIPCGTMDLRAGINQFLQKNSIQNANLRALGELCRGLKIDILGVVYSIDESNGIVLICEIKIGDLSLNDYSQLIGYCIASDTSYGLLISIDGQISRDFKLALIQKPSLVEIKRMPEISHKIGICRWNSDIKNLTFYEDGAFESMPHLVRELAYSFD